MSAECMTHLRCHLHVNAIEEEEAKTAEVIEIDQPTEVNPEADSGEQAETSEADSEESAEATPETLEGGNE